MSLPATAVTGNYESALRAVFLEALATSGSTEQALRAIKSNMDLSPDEITPTRFAQAIGVKSIDYAPMASADAFVEPDGNGFRVVINRERPFNRQMFSLCHEMAHILLGHTGGHRTSGALNARTAVARERLCDEIAGQILMPEGAVRTILGKYGITFDTINLIARSFSASRAAAVLRMLELTTRPAMTIFWRTEGEGLVAASFRRSGDSRGAYLNLDDKAPDGTTPLLALKTRKVARATENLGWSGRVRYKVESDILGRDVTSGVVSLVDLSQGN